MVVNNPHNKQSDIYFCGVIFFLEAVTLTRKTITIQKDKMISASFVIQSQAGQTVLETVHVPPNQRSTPQTSPPLPTGDIIALISFSKTRITFKECCYQWWRRQRCMYLLGET